VPNGKFAEVPTFRISLWKDSLFDAFQQMYVVRSFNWFLPSPFAFAVLIKIYCTNLRLPQYIILAELQTDSLW